ncbi:HlyD family secretion protein [Jiella sp. M17.18]|uniref:HlyD family secretion protein n=1 Tax=Jiella sp. M17.18 TaxID=3234247 RepID=UPI0034DEAE6F
MFRSEDSSDQARASRQGAVTKPATEAGPRADAAPASERPATPAAVPAAPAGPAAPAAAAPAPRRRGRKRILLPILALAVLGAGGWYGHYYWTEGRFLESTDDAYVGADMSVIAPKISGYVESVPVEDNQRVKAGEPLVTIDSGDYELALRAAEAKIATQQATVASFDAQRKASEASVGEAQANLEAARTALAQAEIDLSRAKDLAKRGAGARATQDAAQSARDADAAKVSAAEAALTAAKASLGVVDAQKIEAQSLLRELEVARDQAKRNLSFTVLKAPYDGIVGNRSVEPGNLVSAGQRLASVVPLSGIYVDANFKETQLADIVPGQKATIEIDALPGRELTGTVVSISPASGSVFSLLPTDNATGNFTKVVQRVPVRVAIDDQAALAGRLRPGLSAVVAIDIRTTPKDGAAASAAAQR